MLFVWMVWSFLWDARSLDFVLDICLFPASDYIAALIEKIEKSGVFRFTDEISADVAGDVFCGCSVEQLILMQLENVLCVFQRGMHIVGNHDDGDSQILVDCMDLFIHLLRDDGIQSCCRFIQEQDFFCGAESACEKNALFLASGQFPEAFILKFCDSHAFHVFCGEAFFLMGIKRPAAHLVETSGEDDFADACREIFLDLCRLRKVSNVGRLQPVSVNNLSGSRLFQLKESLDQCAFASAVLAENVKIISCLDVEI